LSAPVTLPTARIEQREDVAFSSEFGDVYHPASGALAQARHVFLAGNELPRRWAGRESFTVLETGFGLGLNFLATWQAWRDDPARCARLHFVSVEGTPVAREALAAALARFEGLAPLARALLQAYPPPLAGFHRVHFDGGRVALTLLLGDAREALTQFVGRADALYLDGFAPARNASIWTPEVIRELARIARPGATLASWTVAGGVRSALADAGFRVDKRPGLPPKREMLAGYRDGTESTASSRTGRTALVVGGGLAGTLVAGQLAARDWGVVVADTRPAPSSAEVGLVRPIVNLRDALNAQASRSAFLYALQHYRALQHDGFHLQWSRCGVLQLAAGEDEAARFEAIVRTQGYPASVLQFVDAQGARELARREVRGAGWWFPSGAVVTPVSLALATAARAGERLARRWNGRVERLERTGGTWRAWNEAGELMGEAPVVVVANAADAARLVPEARLRLARVRGQVTYVPPDPARRMEIVVSGSGYVAPLPQGGHCIGATYQHDDADERVRAHDHRENLERAETMLPGFTHGLVPRELAGWAGLRTTVPDRLPVIGLSSLEGLAFATGLGSRGLLWGPLGAELVASELSDEPLPLPRDLAGAVSPRRFLS
jgi:tRNA 5-methylaminomethyl-2-thiouridine biosynthesis bifunctional protein